MTRIHVNCVIQTRTVCVLTVVLQLHTWISHEDESALYLALARQIKLQHKEHLARCRRNRTVSIGDPGDVTGDASLLP